MHRALRDHLSLTKGQNYRKEEEGIKPDEEFRAHMKLATKEGRIDATGRDIDGLKVSESTEKHPREIVEEYDPKLESQIKVLRRIIEVVSTEKHE